LLAELSVHTLYLASASPRRAALLTQLGLNFKVLSADVPEVLGSHESPAQYSQRVALAKAQAGFTFLRASPELQLEAVVLGADTEVVLAGRVFGKPVDFADAAEMLRSLSGKSHDVLSSVALISAHQQTVVLQQSKVHFKALNDADIARYLESGEAMGKAGAYAIQGLAGAFVSHLEGSYTGVMGLPVFETAALLRRYGIHV
jgi:septum formation protein